MDKTTFQHPEIIKYINQNYYAVKFNGEIKETVTLKDKKYKFVEVPDKRGYNELAYEFLDGKMNYPSLVFLDEKLNIKNIEGIISGKSFYEGKIDLVEAQKILN